MSPDSVLYMLQRVLKRAGLPRIRFHDLRHTFATMALQNGVDVKTVSSMLGHYSAGFTLDTYRRRAAESGPDHGEHSLWRSLILSAIRSRWGQCLGQKKAVSENNNLCKTKIPEILRFRGILARREGFEPPAFWSVARRSIQLS